MGGRRRPAAARCHVFPLSIEGFLNPPDYATGSGSVRNIGLSGSFDVTFTAVDCDALTE